jgi:hypothetical protein
MQQNSINFPELKRDTRCRMEHVQSVMFLMFYVSLSMHYLVRRETIELLTSPRENYPPFVIAFYPTSRRVVLLASDATTVSPSKFYDVETCSGDGDDVYLLSLLFPAFQNLL